MIKNKQTCVALVENSKQKYLTHTWKILRKPRRLETTLPPFLGSYSWCVIIAFYFLQAKTNIGNISKNTPKSNLGSKPPSRLYFWFLFMICYHCILFLFRQKNLENTGKYRKKTWETRPRKKPSVLEATLPANKYNISTLQYLKRTWTQAACSWEEVDPLAYACKICLNQMLTIHWNLNS